MTSDKPRYTHCDTKCVTRELIDVSSDPSWDDVKCVERTIGPLGSLLSVVNHRRKTFEERKAELELIPKFGEK